MIADFHEALRRCAPGQPVVHYRAAVDGTVDIQASETIERIKEGKNRKRGSEQENPRVQPRQGKVGSGPVETLEHEPEV